jgi:16S rRNA G966 N2-methylase RsmD
MERFFPYLEGINYDKLILNKEGRYSITRRSESAQIIECMNTILKTCSDKTITDVTACMGGDTINFSFYFKKVFSIEINPENFKLLQHNISVFECSNIEAFCGDSTKIMNWKSDVVFVDPPWGGPSYRNTETIELYMRNVKLDDWLEKLMTSSYRPSYIFLKLPFNYRTIRFAFLPNFIEMNEVKIYNFYLVSIKVKIENHKVLTR